jgi:excisionase family DNA binding protein
MELDDTWLTTKEAEQYLSVDLSTLIRRRAKGDIIGTKFGRLWRWSRSSIIRYLAKH